MSQEKQTLPEFLNGAFARYRELPQSQIDAGCERVLQRLREEAPGASAIASISERPVVRRRIWGRLAVAAGAAVVVLMVLVSLGQEPSVVGAQALVERADGSFDLLDERLIIKQGRVGRVVLLSDTSRVEMRPGSEIWLEPADDGLRIRLAAGDIIVNAAGGRPRMLYVRTQDLTVKVAAAVFLVSSQDAGSRVAVIQGDAQMRSMTDAQETNLTQGQQFATSPRVELGALSEAVSWSRNAEIHLAQLLEPRLTIEEGCGAPDLRSIVRENGGWNLRLPGVLWRKYRCRRALAGE
jgi:ferric-dicitrate binding protein FerR (iron transport regulator)